MVIGACRRGDPGHAWRQLHRRRHHRGETGDLRRFETPRQLMSYLGLVPSEYSSGNRTLRGGITKAGSKNARRAPMEGVWSDRINARIGPDHQPRLDGLPKVVCEIAWKAQIWLCRRHRHLGARGKPQTVVTTAIAREMGAFIWAIARHVQPIETA